MQLHPTTLASLAVLAIGLAGCFDSENEFPPTAAGRTPADPTPADLKDRTFIATSITGDGQPRALVPGTRIRVTFGNRSRQGLAWEAGCNQAASDVEITSSSLRVGDRIATTLIRCPGDLREQEAWLAEFLISDPQWRLTGERLTLTSGDAVIELEETRHK